MCKWFMGREEIERSLVLLKSGSAKLITIRDDDHPNLPGQIPDVPIVPLQRDTSQPITQTPSLYTVPSLTVSQAEKGPS